MLLPAAWGLLSDSSGSWPSWTGLAVTLCPLGEGGRLAFQPQLSPVPGAGCGRGLFLNGLGSRDIRFYLKRTMNVCGFSEHPFHRSLALPFHTSAECAHVLGPPQQITTDSSLKLQALLCSQLWRRGPESRRAGRAGLPLGLWRAPASPSASQKPLVGLTCGCTLPTSASAHTHPPAPCVSPPRKDSSPWVQGHRTCCDLNRTDGICRDPVSRSDHILEFQLDKDSSWTGIPAGREHR